LHLQQQHQRHYQEQRQQFSHIPATCDHADGLSGRPDKHNPWLYALFLIVMISVRQSVTLWSDEDRAELVFELQTFEGKYTKGHFDVKVMIIFSQP
jgi:hypothetical protein